MPHHGMEQGMGMLGMAFMTLSLLALAVALVGTFLLLRSKGMLPGGKRLRALTIGATETAEPGGAEAYLDMRLARGEIDVDDYHERQSALRANKL